METHTETTLEFTEPQHRRFSDRLKRLGGVHTSHVVQTQPDEPRSPIAALIVRKTPQEGGN
jgi:hypothetical protein